MTDCLKHNSMPSITYPSPIHPTGIVRSRHIRSRFRCDFIPAAGTSALGCAKPLFLGLSAITFRSVITLLVTAISVRQFPFLTVPFLFRHTYCKQPEEKAENSCHIRSSAPDPLFFGNYICLIFA